MSRAQDFLLVASTTAVGAGAAAAAVGFARVAPGGLGAATVVAGVATLVIGVHGLLAWGALPASRAGAGERWLVEAERHAAAGEVAYARTFFEEAVRAGADPDEAALRVAGRLRRDA